MTHNISVLGKSLVGWVIERPPLALGLSNDPGEVEERKGVSSSRSHKSLQRVNLYFSAYAIRISRKVLRKMSFFFLQVLGSP